MSAPTETPHGTAEQRERALRDIQQISDVPLPSDIERMTRFVMEHNPAFKNYVLSGKVAEQNKKKEHVKNLKPLVAYVNEHKDSFSHIDGILEQLKNENFDDNMQKSAMVMAEVACDINSSFVKLQAKFDEQKATLDKLLTASKPVESVLDSVHARSGIEDKDEEYSAQLLKMFQEEKKGRMEGFGDEKRMRSFE